MGQSNGGGNFMSLTDAQRRALVSLSDGNSAILDEHHEERGANTIWQTFGLTGAADFPCDPSPCRVLRSNVPKGGVISA